MKDFKIGKKLYKSSALIQFKITFLVIALWVFVNLYFKTYSDPDFIDAGGGDLLDVISFHYQYPVQFIGYLVGTLTPAIYYAFIRGIVFFEEGVVINRGIPFLNHCIQYSNIDSFKIIHQKYLMSLKRKDLDEELLFTVREIDRVVAIFDQHGIKGDLGKVSDTSNRSINIKLLYIAIVFGVIVSIMQYTGLMIAINRYLFR